ncbi:multiple pdz domain protein [Holotrichia oblita]|uniref:Multiple pdz domain protein n=1 Tax=Holotrichia oblita TaxID=644536 RepID=A0ACB9TQU5_HOLOL|nr:multiple pdz domain protein [Holotrichia oblita]
MAVFVCGINPTGAAYRTGGIQVGDEILESSEEYYNSYPNVRTITVRKGPQGLGIMIIEGKHADVGQGIFISDIQEGSTAEKAGLEIGEMILAVNKDPLLGSNYENVTLGCYIIEEDRGNCDTHRFQSDEEIFCSGTLFSLMILDHPLLPDMLNSVINVSKRVVLLNHPSTTPSRPTTPVKHRPPLRGLQHLYRFYTFVLITV